MNITPVLKYRIKHVVDCELALVMPQTLLPTNSHFSSAPVTSITFEVIRYLNFLFFDQCYLSTVESLYGYYLPNSQYAVRTVPRLRCMRLTLLERIRDIFFYKPVEKNYVFGIRFIRLKITKKLNFVLPIKPLSSPLKSSAICTVYKSTRGSWRSALVGRVTLPWPRTALAQCHI